MKKAGSISVCDFESILDADGAYAQGFNAKAEILRGAGGRRQVEDVVHRAQIEGLADVALFKLEARMCGQVGNVVAIASAEIVDANYGVALGQQAICEVRT
jgi:hypothetical protein